jgi:hypothetical protein
MSIESNPIKNMLYGKNAFYQEPEYKLHRPLERLNTSFELSSDQPLEILYRYEIESKTMRIAKLILSIVIFPIGIYKFLHHLAGKLIVPASSPSLLGFKKNDINHLRKNMNLGSEWKSKRFGIEVDGYTIDVAIMGKVNTLNNGRWVIGSNGNAEFYEYKPSDWEFKQILSNTNANAIVFNYPGVAGSSGMPNNVAMGKAYRAILAFLEDEKKGIGAKEIIGLSHSIGGAAQGNALESHPLKSEIKYIFIKGRTFSDLSTTASELTFKILGLLVKLLGWNMNSVPSSKKLKAHEIIIQTAKVKEFEELNDSSKIIDDGIIPAKGSLGKVLLDDKTCPKGNKTFIGVSAMHNEHLGMKTTEFLSKKINDLLK